MDGFKNAIEAVRSKLIEAFMEIPMELEIDPTPCVIDMSTEKDGMGIFGQVEIVKVSPDGVLWDEEGNNYTIQGGKSPYAIEDIMELHKVVLETAKKKLADEGFNPFE